MAGKCFVIGPMSGKNLNVLKWLAHDVVQALLPDWTVTIPDSGNLGNIMNDVIRSCDRADLVIANTTGNNPNVLYEIGLLDALGRPCIPVKIEGPGASPGAPETMPFDRAAYRYVTIHDAPERRQDTDTELRRMIVSALDTKSKGAAFGNPITDFYGLPLSALSSGLGLARGYFINLVLPALNDLGDSVPEHSRFDRTAFKQWKLEIGIPRDFDYATRGYVDGLVKNNTIRSVILNAKGRRIFLYEFVEQDPACFRWFDIPTTLGSARDIVIARLGPLASSDPTSEDFKAIQADEISQFVRALRGRINRDSSLGINRNQVELKWWPHEAGEGLAA